VAARRRGLRDVVSSGVRIAVYGAPPAELASVPAGARQVSPLVPGAEALEEIADGALDAIVIAAPPGALERRYVMAGAIRALRPGGQLTVVAPKDRGGLRLRKELAAFGCEPAETARRHHRLCVCPRPAQVEGVAEAIAAGGPQRVPRLDLVSQPGVFSWDRPDPGSVLLLKHLGGLGGRGADLGCGVGLLALALLESPDVTALALIDIDRRALDAARRNVVDPRASFLQADLRTEAPALGPLDFVVMNPPFHTGGAADHALGQAFLRRAGALLKTGGLCRFVASVALPYEPVLREAFGEARQLESANGYKVWEAVKGR
jgi:16S rRNA (guanine1207-N2)-methyltransferase